MKNVEILADLFAESARTLHRHVDGLDDDALWWRPDPRANSIGHTVWHVSRWMDLLTVVVLQNHDHGEEYWHVSGLREKTGYDPRGIGFNGFGTMTGYSPSEVDAVPRLAKPDLLAYFDQTAGALHAHIVAMRDEHLQKPAPGSHQGQLAYQWIKAVLLGELGHVGEIEALVAMRARADGRDGR